MIWCIIRALGVLGINHETAEFAVESIRPIFPRSSMSATRGGCRPTAPAPMPWEWCGPGQPF